MGLKICCISDSTYRASCPDYENNLCFYGSEQYHSIISQGLVDAGHDVTFVAPQGSQPIGRFVPTLCFNGGYAENEILDEISLEGLKVDYLTQFDFILDFSAVARNVEELNQYHGYYNYGVFRNGYNGYTVPRLRLKERHYICPSNQNTRIFKSHGFAETQTVYYGVPSFYSPGDSEEYQSILNGLEKKNYILYVHRPTSEKGSYHVLQLAQMFPQETFVFMVSNNPVQQHKSALQDLKKQSISLPNVKYVELPLTNKHHYFKRELMRHAKAILSPFNPSIYLEGFGLANAEAVACGTPILISDSESSRELWIDEKDGLILPYDDRMSAFRMAIKHFNSYSFEPTNKFLVSKCISNYEKYINEMILKNSNGNPN